LVNAHDHLELNHYGPWTGGGGYRNASEWIADVEPRLARSAEARARRAWPLRSRLFAGALKNLLAGTTTVAHHNPLYPELLCGYPIRVVRRYGWAHSFALEGRRAGARGEPAGVVQRRHERTPAGHPFIVHLAEGIDAAARRETRRLEALGCLTANAVLVHGVGLEEADDRRVVRSRAALVWCPASNLAILGRTAPVARWRGRTSGWACAVALGTDSRLTGSRDLLEELRAAARAEPACADDLLPLVTTAAANAYRLPQAGRITRGGPADLLVLPGDAATPLGALLAATRRDVALVVVGGRPLVGRTDLHRVFAARRVGVGRLRVDGVEKCGAREIVAAAGRLPVSEPGVECLSCA
jgi:cytosine/adenosine deaminase-related metal-dependent hydrolase